MEAGIGELCTGGTEGVGTEVSKEVCRGEQ